MAISNQARAADIRHIRQFKKLTPKARFKSLPKADQYVVYARALADIREEDSRKARSPIAFFIRSITIASIADKYLEFEPATGRLTKDSIRKIKRAFSNAFKASLGQEAYFMYAIEQQDKKGMACIPHMHGMAITPQLSPTLAANLQKVAGSSAKGSVKLEILSKLPLKPKERVLGDTDVRRWAQYSVKNDLTVVCRSRALIQRMPPSFEGLKGYYGS